MNKLTIAANIPGIGRIDYFVTDDMIWIDITNEDQPTIEISFESAKKLKRLLNELPIEEAQ